MLRFICLFATLACALGQIASRGNNQYLPPDSGYNYDKPVQPFETGKNNVLYKPPPPAVGPVPPAPQKPQRPQEPQQPRPTSYPSGPNPQLDEGHVHVPGMPFDFNYAVNDIETANDYSHKASSDGDVVRGEYRVALPDGRTQIVRYEADWKTGYHATVTYEGVAQYPDQPQGQASNNQGYKY